MTTFMLNQSEFQVHSLTFPTSALKDPISESFAESNQTKLTLKSSIMSQDTQDQIADIKISWRVKDRLEVIELAHSTGSNLEAVQEIVLMI